ncbi:MAG: hypothetical protein HKN32_02515, partial [Flavobacteriales bacterium]|nr:hypothetical protein [Flavobacteriales bacterium]
MKKLFTLLFASSVLLTNAQDPFTLSIFGDDYVPLEGSTSLNNGEVWDDPSYDIPIGFDFYLFDQGMQNILLSDWGVGGMLTTPVTGDEIQILVAYGSDIIDPGYYQDSSQANISYQVDGNFPTRIFKLEWDNCAFWDELSDTGTSGNRVSFQLWL